jgi:hypothetical protein
LPSLREAAPIRSGIRNDEKGFLGKIGDVIQQKTGLTAEDLKEKAGDMLARDAKQAVNYEVRKGMRDILKDLF